MHIDDNNFFREATLRICSSLEIEKALQSCLLFLRKAMPLNRAYLQCGDCDQQTMRTIAMASPTECRSVDYLTHLSDEVLSCSPEDMVQHHGVYFVDSPEESAISREMLNFHHEPCTGLMILPLISEEQIVGHLVCLTEQDEKFSEEHGRLIALLKEPFTIALSNTLKHRSELKLYDRNFFWDATMRICSSLEIEQALFSTLEFLQQEMPVNWMALEHYDEKLDSIRIIALADENGGKGVDILTPLSPDARAHIEEKYREGMQRVQLILAPQSNILAQEMLEFHDVKATSLIVLQLESGGGILGTLVLGSAEKESFSQSHADLLSLLSEPFAIALSNTLKHRNELRLFERDFLWEATTRICGSLQIEESLHNCLLFLKEYMPAEEAALTYFDPGKETVTLNVHADAAGGHLVNLEVVYPPEVRAMVKDMSQPEEYIINRADEHPFAVPVLKAMNRGRSSIMVVRLIVEQVWIGSVVLWASGWDKFNEEHLRLLKQLKQPFFIAMSNSRRFRELLDLKELLADDNRYLHDELQRISGYEIIGADFGLKDVMDKVRRVASLSSPVLLLGETGVGKEIIAGAIHNASSRREGPFIKVNCGAIHESLLDSELFGHEKGAFTGAIGQKRGRFERASGGTIFLDEIGELPPEAQVRLLRVLQEKEIERVGGTEPVKVDIRVIAATHRDLETMIKEGKFREDLYFRLQVFPIAIPALRERSGDIPGLVQHFIHKKARDLKLSAIPTLAQDAYEQLLAHNWPGNVRELENAVERAIILNRDGPLRFADLRNKKEASGADVTAETDMVYNLDQVAANHIRSVLKTVEGKIEGKNGAAELLGMHPGTLRHRMRKLKIPFGKKAKYAQ